MFKVLQNNGYPLKSLNYFRNATFSLAKLNLQLQISGNVQFFWCLYVKICALCFLTASQAGSSNLCDMCSTEKGSWKCVECKQHLCNNCKVLHLNVPFCKNHQVIPAEEADTVIDSLLFCEKHPDELVIRNCRQCEELLCVSCKEAAHDSHKTETLEGALDRVLPEMEVYCEKIKKTHC